MVCVPSMGDIRAEYRYLIPQLVVDGRRVVSMDVRGHGETSVRWPDYSVAGVGQDILDLIASLDAGSAVLVGTSMAAGAAVWAAAEKPAAVTGLVMIGPFVGGEGSWSSRLLYTTLFARPWGPSMWLKYFRTLYPSQKPADFESYCQALYQNLRQTGRLEALRSMLLASKGASEKRLGKVGVPVQILMGTKDPDFKNPQAEAESLAHRLGAALTMIPGAGHYPHAEMPDQAGAAILDFLKSLSLTRDAAYVA